MIDGGGKGSWNTGGSEATEDMPRKPLATVAGHSYRPHPRREAPGVRWVIATGLRGARSAVAAYRSASSLFGMARPARGQVVLLPSAAERHTPPSRSVVGGRTTPIQCCPQDRAKRVVGLQAYCIGVGLTPSIHLSSLRGRQTRDPAQRATTPIAPSMGAYPA